ncbi:MAG: hypothetical protein HC778_00015 [Chamaesiphon sp. CSU_1_12]|nr:hypothetical protein [Chamaesiphon sp. CSU_1_12]
MAQWCLRVATEYARSRITFGKPISEHQGVSFMLADNLMDMHAARLTIWSCASRNEQRSS